MIMTMCALTIAIGASSALLTGCGTSEAPTDGVEFQTEAWDYAIDGGFAVTPVAASHEIAEANEATALFTNEFFAALQTSLPETPLVSPHEALNRLTDDGHGSHEQLRSLRRVLRQNEQLDHEKLVAISRDLQHRFVLVGWFDEIASEGVRGAQAVGQFETTDYGLTWMKIDGQATVVVLDLWEDEILWRAFANYTTDRIYVKGDEFQAELDRTRIGAAVRLADQMSGR
jgi:hypothetical protein